MNIPLSSPTASESPTGSFLDRYPFFCSVLVITIAMCFQFSLFRPYFQLNDDTFKVFFAQGVGTNLTPSEYIGYSNCLWGFVLKALYTYLPGVAWYGVLMLWTQALSLLAFLYAALLTPHSRFKAWVFVIAWIGFYFVFFAKIQFTATSSLAAQAGIFLALSLWQAPKTFSRPYGWWFSGFLIFLSSLIRLEGFLITFLIALPILVTFIKDPFRKKNRVMNLSKYIFLLIVSGLVLFGVLFNSYWYDHDPGWRAFNQFDKERVEFQDYRITEYTDRTKPYFDSVGWTQNDYRMFLSWYYTDAEVFSAEKVRELKSHFPRIGSGNKTMSYESVTQFLFSYGGKAFLAFYLALLLFVPLPSLRILLFQLGLFLGFFAFLIYFFRAPDHVVVPLLVLLLNTAIYHTSADINDFIPARRNWKLLTGMVFLAVIASSDLYALKHFHQENLHNQEEERTLNDYVRRLNPSDGQLYVISNFPYELFDGLDNFLVFKSFHIFEMAVYGRSPVASKMMDHFHVKDLLMDIVDKPNMFLVCTGEEGMMYQTYMKEKRQMTVYPELYFNCPYFKVYRIHSKRVIQ